MRDMNDLYVSDHCQTRVHIDGYVFTIAELFANALAHLTKEELEKYEDHEIINN